jgi:hypothetical protein
MRDAILQQGRISGMMNITVNHLGVQPYLATLLQFLGRGILNQNLINGLPGLGANSPGIFLQGRLTGVLSHLQPGEGS